MLVWLVCCLCSCMTLYVVARLPRVLTPFAQYQTACHRYTQNATLLPTKACLMGVRGFMTLKWPEHRASVSILLSYMTLSSWCDSTIILNVCWLGDLWFYTLITPGTTSRDQTTRDHPFSMVGRIHKDTSSDLKGSATMISEARVQKVPSLCK